ncbi:MAG: hypothetical protein KAS67_03125, partial [Thermoplasmata archaeon]|nr:hypothetical protein [Thermoplasmata archaeon]
MSNELTHAFAASASQCALNLLIGAPVLDHNVFIAAILAMAINLDRFGPGESNRSPIGHSIG